MNSLCYPNREEVAMSRRRGDEVRSSGSTLQLAMPLHDTVRRLLDIPRERGRDSIQIRIQISNSCHAAP